MILRLAAADIVAGDLIERNESIMRVQSVTPSASGKIVTLSYVVESSTDPDLFVGRGFRARHRAGTLLTVHRA